MLLQRQRGPVLVAQLDEQRIATFGRHLHPGIGHDRIARLLYPVPVHLAEVALGRLVRIPRGQPEVVHRAVDIVATQRVDAPLPVHHVRVAVHETGADHRRIVFT